MDVSPRNAVAGKKVLYVITKASWGGAQVYLNNLILEARAAGATPLLAYGVDGLLNERLTASGITTNRVPGLVRDPSLKDDVRTLFEFVKLFRTVRPDVVHLNSSKAGFTGALAARLAGVPKIIFTSHGWAFTESRGLLGRAFFLVLHYITVLLSHTTIVVSSALLSHTKNWLFVQKKIHMVHLGIITPDLLTRENARTELARHNPSLSKVSEKIWVGTIAELHPNKGLDTGIAAWNSFLSTASEDSSKSAQWVIIGGGEKEIELKKQAEGIEGLHFLGFVPDASLYLKAFDLFLLPSRTEALGYVLIEAGFAGAPVIAANVGGIPEVVVDPAMRFPKNSPAEISSLLHSLLTHPNELPVLGEKLKKHVEKEFSLERMARETFELY